MERSEEPPAGTLDELAQVPMDGALDALNHIQRRKLLVALLAEPSPDDSPVVRTDPKEAPDGSDRFVTTDRRHLSKLAEYGFISWNRDTHEVTRGSNFDDIDPLLQLLVDNEGEFPDGWL